MTRPSDHPAHPDSSRSLIAVGIWVAVAVSTGVCLLSTAAGRLAVTLSPLTCGFVIAVALCLNLAAFAMFRASQPAFRSGSALFLQSLFTLCPPMALGLVFYPTTWGMIGLFLAGSYYVLTRSDDLRLGELSPDDLSPTDRPDRDRQSVGHGEPTVAQAVQAALAETHGNNAADVQKKIRVGGDDRQERTVGDAAEGLPNCGGEPLRDSRFPTGAGEAQRPEAVAENNLDADEAAESDSGDVVQWMQRSKWGKRREVIEGTVRVDFSPGQKQAMIHLTFWPPLCERPQLECENLSDSPIRLKVSSLYTFGARIEAKRSQAVDTTAEVEIGFTASTGTSTQDAA